jgi:hypothetical protein
MIIYRCRVLLYCSYSINCSGNLAPEIIHKKNEQLLNYLHDVKVYSTGTNPTIRPTDATRETRGKLPVLNRLDEPINENSADGVFGYVEPQRIPPGRVSLRQFLAYLQQHRDSPEEYSIDRFSEMYTIKPDITRQLFKYHSLLSLHEVSRSQSRTSDKALPEIAVDALNIEHESTKESISGTSLTSKH